MRKKWLVAGLCAMVLAFSACGATQSDSDYDKNDKTSKADKDSGQSSSKEDKDSKKKSKEYQIQNDTVTLEDLENAGGEVLENGNYVFTDYSGAAVEFPIQYLNSYTCNNGEKLFYMANNVPEWWDGDVEVVIDGSYAYLEPVPFRDDIVLVFRHKNSQRILNQTREDYENNFQTHANIMKSFIPEGWRVLIDESTLYDAVMYNDELDVRIHFRDRTRWAADTYAYDQSKDAFYWNDISEKGESNHFTYEKPDYIEYDLQVYAEYLGYSKEEYLNDYYPISLYRRTEPDGSVFIDYDTDERSLLVSITEEDYFKMQNAGKYTAILTLTGRTFNCVFERDSDYAVFCYYFLDEQWNGFWDPNSIDYYVYDIK